MIDGPEMPCYVYQIWHLHIPLPRPRRIFQLLFEHPKTRRLPSREGMKLWVTCSPPLAWKQSLNRWKSSQTRKPCVRFGTTRRAAQNFNLSLLSTRDRSEPFRAGYRVFRTTGPGTEKNAPPCVAPTRTGKGRHQITRRKTDGISASEVRFPPCDSFSQGS